MNYYNENDPKAAQWLRNLIAAGLIPAGEVDERSIAEVMPNDLRGFTQCHFFAGIGGWLLALQLAGVPADRPLWTGSCPCQPFSVAGKRKGTDDERHLWPEFARLITECAPPIVFGEQVASKDGRVWLAGVCADLETLGYAVGGADLCAAGIGAPHIRQRLYWVANSCSKRLEIGKRDGRVQREEVAAHPRQAAERGCDAGRLVLADSDGRASRDTAPSPARYWDTANTTNCGDGKTRRIPIQPAFQPLAHGIPARVVRLRGYGNAIVPPLAAEFIAAFFEVAA